jgi:hypothetical protein
MTPEKKRDLREEAARLKQQAERMRAEREISKRKFDRAIAGLRELSGRR